MLQLLVPLHHKEKVSGKPIPGRLQRGREYKSGQAKVSYLIGNVTQHSQSE